MFADMKGMVVKAWHEHYVLLAINCVDLESTHAAIRMAEKNRVPIILSLCQGHLAHFPAPVATVVVKTLAGSALVPVVLALGRGKSPNCIRQTFCAGFSGLMIDTSTLPSEENVRQARAVVELVTNAQPCVEGELGHLADAPRYDQATNADTMTQPTNAESFIMQTGVDLLAISIGTVHGMYVSSAVPAIDFQYLTEVFHCSSMPLALHGGNGTSFNQLQPCTILGVARINVRTTTSEWGKSAPLYTLRRDISIELVDAPKAMELALEEAIIPYL